MVYVLVFDWLLRKGDIMFGHFQSCIKVTEVLSIRKPSLIQSNLRIATTY